MPQEQVTALLGALSNLCTLPEHRILSKKISTSKSQPGSPEWARAAPYKWENGHKRKAAGAGLAACPAGIGYATGTGPSQDHIPWGLEPSGTGKVQVQGALAAPQPSAQPCQCCPPNRGVLVHPLPPKLWHHTTACHLHLLREAAPGPCQTPHHHDHTDPPSMALGPACTTLGTPASTCSPQGIPQLPSRGVWVCQVSWGQAGHLGSNNEGVLEHRDEQGSALQHSQTLGIGDNCPALGCRFAQEKTKP